MDMSSAEWFSLLEMEDAASMIHEYRTAAATTTMTSDVNEEDLNNWFGFEPSDLDDMLLDNDNINSGANHRLHQQQANNVVKEKIKFEYSATAACDQRVISFGCSDEYYDYNSVDIIKPPNPIRMSNKRSSIGVCSQEHVLVERKRREIMNQRFLDLSALIPHLNKMDKASILGDAAKYLKELEEQVKSLEEQTTKRTVESVVLVKQRHDSNPGDEDSSSSENLDEHSSNPPFEIEAKASNKNVLIRIHCQKDHGLVQRILNEIEKLHPTTLNSSTMPFGGYAMIIIIIAQMNDDLSMSMKDLVMHLKLALLRHFCYLHKS